MRAVIQRVSEAEVKVEGAATGGIGKGLLVLAGFEDADSDEDLIWMANKIIQLRIFNDESEMMNLSIMDIKGQLLLVSQFTLHAQSKKGNRPSFIRAAKPEVAIPLYEKFKVLLHELSGKKNRNRNFWCRYESEFIE
jgi:D-tyrosyl-tRNA(Tyr) deacylase